MRAYIKTKFQISFQLININIPEFLVVVTYIFQEDSHMGSFLFWATKQNPVFHLWSQKHWCFILTAVIGLLFLRTKFSSDLPKVTQEVHSKTESQSIFNPQDYPCIWLDLEP